MYKLLYYYIKKYWYHEYFPISCDFGAELDLFTPKYHILKTIGNILYIILWTTHRQKFTQLYPHLQQLFSNFSRLLHWFYLFNPKTIEKFYNSQALSDSSIENTPLPLCYQGNLFCRVATGPYYEIWILQIFSHTMRFLNKMLTVLA